MTQTHSLHQRSVSEGHDGFPDCRTVPLGAMVRAICQAASGGPDLLYEMMLKAMLMVDAAAPTYGLSTWSLTLGTKPQLQWSEGLMPEELEEAEEEIINALKPGFDSEVKVGDRSLCFLLVAPAVMREGGAIYGRYVKPLDVPQAKCLGALSDVGRLARSHIELLQGRNVTEAETCTSSIPSSTLPGMIFTSRLMSEVAVTVERIKDSESTILITGESGTGKELVARAIHRLSRRSQHSFVPFNCTAGPPDLIESTLFGHRRGAFTGALSEQLGVIRAAEGGTLFLDEIGDLPLSVQPKLLRFLQEGEIHPLGERTPRQVSVRVLAATHKNLEAAVREGTFRADLYYRVTGLTVHLPPLRERPDDIRELISHFLTYYSRRNDRAVAGITADAIQALQGYSWPGNVRELAAEIERLVLYAEPGNYVSAKHISQRILPLEVRQHENGNGSSANLEHMLAEFERRVITETLIQHDCNVARASEALGLGSRQTLYKKLKRLTIDISEFLQEDTEPGLQLRTPRH
jgi:transcriptional regulator with GAF, ATPase, and Fis domain